MLHESQINEQLTIAASSRIAPSSSRRSGCCTAGRRTFPGCRLLQSISRCSSRCCLSRPYESLIPCSAPHHLLERLSSSHLRYTSKHCTFLHAAS